MYATVFTALDTFGNTFVQRKISQSSDNVPVVKNPALERRETAAVHKDCFSSFHLRIKTLK